MELFGSPRAPISGRKDVAHNMMLNTIAVHMTNNRAKQRDNNN